MAKFYLEHYQLPRQSVIEDFYEEVQETEKYRLKEINAAVKIQALWRMYRQRKHYLEEQWAVKIIKRVYIGYRTRKNFWKLINQQLSHYRLMFYSSAATAIQRIYRGFYSRKYFHDFGARKKYLKHIEGKNERRIAKMHEYAKQQELEEQRRQEDYARMEFYKLASSLHHLTSTKAIPGVYRGLEEVSDFGKHTLKA
ncbi:unnamed protein product [Blepharisma stoltei]|uniref:Spermatogenesis-associated protein 17 n=1 Tax=Blepharisma stoltei TaxID=1481888 RepID=A0AAU9IKR7_9CILI|nr:unnamed protein product [Blepharisma stoltei]